MWFAGIDWADRSHDIVVIDQAGRKVASLHIEHTPAGMNKLVRFLRDIAPLDQIACILEIKHGLLITALLEAGLKQGGIPLRRRWLQRCMNSFMSLSSLQTQSQNVPKLA